MKIAISGTHGTGKTTALMETTTQVKMDNPGKEVGVLMEVARQCPGPLNKEATELSQLWIFAKQLEQEIALLRPHGPYDILITDRSLMDNVAYAKVMCMPIWSGLFWLASNHVKTYDKIIFKTIANNDHWHDDGVRDVSDPVFRRRVEDVLLGLYNMANVKVEHA